ncbi:MAG: hypothetical protein A2Y89_02270 [Chloroflexi bacterium RBG_13_51_18]|nr:MAG: hypothetical protein A2Y89_02270 [Chloroflexi bacterium RBG_13_51_18]
MASTLKKAICLGWLLALFSAVIWVAPVQAQGGFAMSGSFYAQKLELPQGTILRTPDIYVVIFNNSAEDINVKMTTRAPLGVTIVLSEYDFPLSANSQKKLEVGLDIGMEAVPGDYKIGITAEPYKEGGEGIQIVGGAGQEADLTITGDFGSVDISTVSTNGAPVPAMIILFRAYEKDNFEIARTETGSLITNVSPGNYLTRVYIAGRNLAEESFAVAADEQKTISLTVKTVYFEGFEIVPLNQRDTETLVMVRVVATVKNLLDAFNDVKVNLLVSSDTQQDNINIISLSRLEKGDVELSNNYVPGDGWRQGVYLFKLELEVGGQIYTTSQAKGLKIDETGKASLIGVGSATDIAPSASTTSPADTEAGSSFTWLIIIGAAAGVLIIAAIIALVIRRKK